MRFVVTGAAGFIGSSTVDRLLADGHQVVGVDSLDPYYAISTKRLNLASALEHENYKFHEMDVLQPELLPLLEGADVVVHLAGQPGVRRSWGAEFGSYMRNNIEATDALAAGCVAQRVGRIVYASSSSIYGQSRADVTGEETLPKPFSPYGITKLAGEQLVHAYGANFEIDTVSLRYFTVYGPRQRPDMAFHRFFRALASGDEIEVYGNGRQIRDFTYVSDVVDATVLAATKKLASGSVFNVAGGSRHRLMDTLAIMKDITGSTSTIRMSPPQPGDVKVTAAAVKNAEGALGWVPSVDLEAGLRQQFDWQSATSSK